MAKSNFGKIAKPEVPMKTKLTSFLFWLVVALQVVWLRSPTALAQTGSSLEWERIVAAAKK